MWPSTRVHESKSNSGNKYQRNDDDTCGNPDGQTSTTNSKIRIQLFIFKNRETEFTHEVRTNKFNPLQTTLGTCAATPM